MKALSIICYFSIFLPIVVAGQAPDTAALHAERLLQGYAEVYGFSGTIKMVKGGAPFFEGSYGFADRSFGVPNTAGTRFSINSISKTFTAAAVLLLAKEGKADLYAPISRYLPELQATWRDSVTLHHLLCHSSGLPREPGVQVCDERSLAEQAEQLVAPQRLLFPPGEKYSYSNSGFILLGAALEAIAGQPYDVYIEKHILGPIGLGDTGFYRGRAVVQKQATPYRLSPQGLAFTERSKHYGENAGGGMYSTVSDLYRYARSMARHEILGALWGQRLFTPYFQTGETDREGYGWSLKDIGGKTYYFSAGSGYGTKSVILYEPLQDDFIGITSNWGNTPILPMLRGLFLTLQGGQPEPPQKSQLAKPARYLHALGEYRFPKGELQRHLGTDTDSLTLQAFEGKLFLNEELLAQKADGLLGLTYTEELLIRATEGQIILQINGFTITGERVRP